MLGRLIFCEFGESGCDLAWSHRRYRFLWTGVSHKSFHHSSKGAKTWLSKQFKDLCSNIKFKFEPSNIIIIDYANKCS